MLEQFKHLAGYNAWANARIYEAVLALDEEQQGMMALLDAAFRTVGAVAAYHAIKDEGQRAQLAAFARQIAGQVDAASNAMFGLEALVSAHLPQG